MRTRSYKGHHNWTPQQKRDICTILAELRWDGSAASFPEVAGRALARIYGVRYEEQLKRQLLAAIVRKRGEVWAVKWRQAWASANGKSSKPTKSSLEEKFSRLQSDVNRLLADKWKSLVAAHGYLTAVELVTKAGVNLDDIPGIEETWLDNFHKMAPEIARAEREFLEWLKTRKPPQTITLDSINDHLPTRDERVREEHDHPRSS